MSKQIALGNSGYALVDDADYAELNQYRWTESQGYAVRMIKVGDKRTSLLMHRALVIAPPGFEIDHANRDGLDNRRSNLRVATRSQNNANKAPEVTGGTSGYKGVCWRDHARAWKAYIKIDHKQQHLGYFRDKIDAARAYNEAAIRLFGDFARLNPVLGDTR